MKKEGKGPWKGGYKFHKVGSRSLMRGMYGFGLGTQHNWTGLP